MEVSKDTSENVQSSRGEKALNIKADFENSQTKSQNQNDKTAQEVGEQIVSGSMYVEQNSELDDMLNEATTTQEQRASEEKIEVKSKSQKMTVEQAMDISLKGLVGLTKMAGDYSGKEIEVSQSSAMIFATLTAPLVMKYGARFSFDPNEVDLDSWMPEMMAFGGLAVVGYPMFKQMQAPKIKVVNKSTSEGAEGVENGDKP